MRSLALVLLLGSVASARSTIEVQYALKDVFQTATRFVRIDRNCKVTDRDPEAAFVTFECDDDGKTKRGALEMFGSGERVRLQLTLGDEPHYLEMRFMELFERKLREELGPPITPAKKPPPPPPPDAGM